VARTTTLGPYSAVLGYGNHSGAASHRSPPELEHTASGSFSSLSGVRQRASSAYGSVSGGCAKPRPGRARSRSTVFVEQQFSVGRRRVSNHCDRQCAAVSGGNANVASGTFGAWVGGGWRTPPRVAPPRSAAATAIGPKAATTRSARLSNTASGGNSSVTEATATSVGNLRAGWSVAEFRTSLR